MERRWRRVVAAIAAVAFALAFSLGSRCARADDGETDDAHGSDGFDPGERGAVTGIGTLLLTSLVGGLLMGRARTTFARDAGTDIAGFGFAAAPLAGHLVNGEYARAAAFTATPLVMAAADVGLMQSEPDVIDEQGSPKTRVPFAIFFTVGLTSGVVGIVDTFFATARRDRRREPARDELSVASVLRDLHVSPTVLRDGGSLSVGGRW